MIGLGNPVTFLRGIKVPQTINPGFLSKTYFFSSSVDYNVICDVDYESEKS
jgi:hypothetical protein